MNRAALRLYSRSPVWAQNLMVSLYGAQLRWQRHGRAYRETLAELRRSERLSRGDLERLQLDRLNRILAAAREVALYRERGLPAELPAPLHLLPRLMPVGHDHCGRVNVTEFRSFVMRDIGMGSWKRRSNGVLE